METERKTERKIDEEFGTILERFCFGKWLMAVFCKSLCEVIALGGR